MSNLKRTAKPALSASATDWLNQFELYLKRDQDVSAPTLRNYLSDLRQFVAWYEQAVIPKFEPAAITTAILTRYRAYLQESLKPSSVNRALISLKRWFGWLVTAGKLQHDPARAVKLVGRTLTPPRQLSDSEEDALVAAVSSGDSLRDRTIIILMLHTGLRASEVCQLERRQLQLVKRSGSLTVKGKGNKYREIPLNKTARQALEEYLPTLDQKTEYLFPSEQTGQALTVRALGHLIKKYSTKAKLRDVSPHDLRHRFGYRMAEFVPLHRLAQLMGHQSVDTTMLYVRGSQADLLKDVEKIAWN
jgi:integrase/recombinase XerC